MIPPSRASLRRMIEQWLRQDPSRLRGLSPPQVQERISAVQEPLMEAFDAVEGQLQDKLMADKKWGTPSGMDQFHQQRIEAWEQLISEYLPTESTS